MRQMVLATAIVVGLLRPIASTAQTVAPFGVCDITGGADAFRAQGRSASDATHGQPWFLRNRDYYDPLFAEPRAAVVKVLFPGFSDPVPFTTATKRQLVWDISVGKEMPIVGHESTSAKQQSLTPGNWGWGIWFPLAFHMVEYMHQPSNPILDTDYRFNGMLKIAKNIARRPFAGERQPPARFLAARLNIGHESTHLGDEYTIRARREFPSTFERINVSYEYWEYGASYAFEHGENYKNLLTVRHGGIGLLKQKKGFYTADPFETGGRAVLASKRNFEPYFGVQWDCENGETGGCLTERSFPHWGWDPFVSADMRLRTVYNYAKTSADQLEDREWSLNVLAGVLRRTQRSAKGSPGLYLRYYHGVNPAGQFRSQAHYSLVGFGVLFDL